MTETLLTGRKTSKIKKALIRLRGSIQAGLRLCRSYTNKPGFLASINRILINCFESCMAGLTAPTRPYIEGSQGFPRPLIFGTE